MSQDYSSVCDSKLWEAFKEGREDAFAFIFQKYSSLLFSYGLHIARDQEIVKDCIQNLFVRLWDSKENLSSTNSIKFYLFKCLKRSIVADLLASKKYQCIDEITQSYDFEVVNPFEHSLISDQISKEECQNLSRAINKLTNRQKEAVYLLYYSNLSHKEVAAIMSLKVTAVYNLNYNALVSLKKTMTKVSISLLLLTFFF